jgi:hypothetical protein
MPDTFGRQLSSAILNTAFTRIGRIDMLKIRMQGTKKDLHWFRRILERQEGVDVKSVSEPFANKGTNKYFRVYAEVERTEK